MGFGSFSQAYIGVNGGGDPFSDVMIRGAASYEWPLKKAIYFQVELAFAHRGNPGIIQKLDIEKQYVQSSFKYIEIPFLMKFKLESNSFALYAIAGPKIAYGVDLSASYTDGRGFYEEHLSYSTLGINRFDFGFNAGAGIEKIISRDRKIFLDFRVYLGLYDVDYNPNTEIYNQGKVVNLGFALPIY